MRRAANVGVSAAVLHRGDPVAGALLLVHVAPDGGELAYQRTAEGWRLAAATAAGPRGEAPGAVAAHVERQRGYDPDLWVVELLGGEIEPFIAETFVND